MAKRFFGAKNITHILYGLIMLLPMFSILSRVIYIQANPNAKDSYSDYKEMDLIPIAYNDFNNNEIYEMSYKQEITIDTAMTTSYLNINYISLTANDLSITQTAYDEITKWRITYTPQSSIQFVNSSNVLKATYLWNSNTKSFYFTGNVNANYFVVADIKKSIILQGTLDNAFDYSLNSFVTDNNMGNIDLFGWFTNLFLNGANPVNALYIGFVNWYLNYALLVSSGYLIFMVLIWFINFVRKIMDKSMYQDYGGF